MLGGRSGRRAVWTCPRRAPRILPMLGVCYKPGYVIRSMHIGFRYVCCIREYRSGQVGPPFCHFTGLLAATSCGNAGFRRRSRREQGETIAPAVLQEAEWKTIVSKRHKGFYQRERREAAERRALNALLQPTDSASSPADKAHNNRKYVISRKKTAERKKRPPIPRLPRDDRKIVVRPRNLNLRTIPPAHCWRRNEDQLRIKPHNTFTTSTPSDERAQLYLNLPGIPLMAYLPAPDNAVRGVIYGALGDESVEEIIELCTIENPKLQILSARRMGQSRAMVITFASTKLPRIVKFHRGYSSSRSRDRSASFPPLEEMKKGCSNQSGGRSGNSKTSNSHDNKKSEKTSRESELLEYKAINKKLLDAIAQMQKAKVEKAENQNSPPKFASLSLAKLPCASTSLPSTSGVTTNMDTDANRGTQKRQSSESIDTAAKKLAETSSEGEPVPRFKFQAKPLLYPRMRIHKEVVVWSR
ncbi:hypothetical protein HPB49_013220 [Dermacentor silvarum]|uniref:Uncharacterized protein n=1 Tax=Dermacentor silvarum TaxID=543639 RepID=A0ACB8DD43_DERSI|nr:hypothetical protein HPB49_013220 [Dermacentor silvarum]